MSRHSKHQRNRGNSKARRLFLEPLEPRHLMAVAISQQEDPIEILPACSDCLIGSCTGVIDSTANTVSRYC
jgi:hypothetical protein